MPTHCDPNSSWRSGDPPVRFVSDHLGTSGLFVRDCKEHSLRREPMDLSRKGRLSPDILRSVQNALASRLERSPEHP